MKKITSTAILFLLCLNLFAQDKKPCHFIGLYDSNGKGVCSDRAMEHEDVADMTAYYTKRTEFMNAHNKQNPQTYFIDIKETVVTYEYQKHVGGWNCDIKVISVKKGKSLEECQQIIADQLAKNPSDFKTQPTATFTWKGNGDYKSEFTKDFGGLSGKFLSANKNAPLIVAQLTNNTTNKRAMVILRTDDGKMTREYVEPGITFTKKYNGKTLEIQVEYEDFTTQKPPFRTVEFLKNKLREKVINDRGEIKMEKADPAVFGIRG
jgi:hypothetical protein